MSHGTITTEPMARTARAWSDADEDRAERRADQARRRQERRGARRQAIKAKRDQEAAQDD